MKEVVNESKGYDINLANKGRNEGCYEFLAH